MDKMSNGFKYSRVLSIYTKLMDGEVINKAAEAEYFGVNQRTIQRDIDDLRMFFEDKAAEGDVRRELIYSREDNGYRLVTRGEDALTNSEALAVCKILSVMTEFNIVEHLIRNKLPHRPLIFYRHTASQKLVDYRLHLRLRERTAL